MKNVTRITLLTSIERFYGEVPRAAARAEDFDGLTLFVRDGEGWPYYARPAATGVAPSVEDVTRVRARVARVIRTDADGPVCVGSYQRAGDVVEIVGVGTLPSARRRGLGTAATATLTRHALEQGAEIVFMSAGDDDVARVYERVGYRRVATACIAGPTWRAATGGRTWVTASRRGRRRPGSRPRRRTACG